MKIYANSDVELDRLDLSELEGDILKSEKDDTLLDQMNRLLECDLYLAILNHALPIEIMYHIGYLNGLRVSNVKKDIVIIVSDKQKNLVSKLIGVEFIRIYSTIEKFIKANKKEDSSSDSMKEQFIKYVAAALYFTGPKEEGPNGECEMTISKKQVEEFLKFQKLECCFDDNENLVIKYTPKITTKKKSKETIYA